jgi:hypothetical protein
MTATHIAEEKRWEGSNKKNIKTTKSDFICSLIIFFRFVSPRLEGLIGLY